MTGFSGKRLFLIVLTIALAAVFAEVLVFAQIDHDHTGEDCPVCLQIEIAKNLLKSLSLASLVALFGALQSRAGTVIHRIKILFIDPTTPITLKVKSTT
jgi:hypothetical protein